jgi:hypothetical protein
VPAHRFSSDDGAISWQQAPFPPSDEWNLGNRERPSTVREEDRLRHYLWFSFSCAGAVAVQIEQGNESVRIARLGRGHDGLLVV